MGGSCHGEAPSVLVTSFAKSEAPALPCPAAPVPLRVLLPKKQLDFLMPGEGGRCGLPCFGFG